MINTAQKMGNYETFFLLETANKDYFSSLHDISRT